MPVGALLRSIVLTRSGVAKRLGKSIATVRRLEGRELFPIVDTQGVHRFPNDQVQRLLLRLHAGDSISGARGDWLLGGRSQRSGRRSTREASTAAEGDDIDRERAAAQQEVALTIIEMLDARQLRRLGPELADYLDRLLEQP